MKTLEYDIGADDYAAFNLRIAQQSPAARRRMLAFRLVSIAAILVLMTAVTKGFRHDAVAGLVMAVGWSVVGWFLVPWSWHRRVRKAARAYFAESAAGRESGHHRLTIEEAGLREQTDTAEALVAWAGIVRIDDAEEHVFVYVGPMAAFIIPKRGRWQEGEEFLQEIRRRAPQISDRRMWPWS